MGRKKQRTSKSTSTPEVSTGLEPAWSSSPTRPPRYVLYCYNHENERQYVVNSYALYAIRKIFDALTDGQDIEPSTLDPDHTMTFGNVDIKSDQMDQILNHHYSKAEEAWELKAPYPNDIERFLGGGRMSKELQHRDEGDKTPREKKAPVEKKPKVDRSQFITVQSIAEELKMDPRDARAALRKAKVEKPVGGWMGDEAWAKGIRDVLAKAAKEKK